MAMHKEVNKLVDPDYEAMIAPVEAASKSKSLGDKAHEMLLSLESGLGVYVSPYDCSSPP